MRTGRGGGEGGGGGRWLYSALVSALLTRETLRALLVLCALRLVCACVRYPRSLCVCASFWRGLCNVGAAGNYLSVEAV